MIIMAEENRTRDDDDDDNTILAHRCAHVLFHERIYAAMEHRAVHIEMIWWWMTMENDNAHAL